MKALPPFVGKCKHFKQRRSQIYTCLAFFSFFLCLGISKSARARGLAIDRDLQDYSAYHAEDTDFYAPRDPSNYYPSDAYVYVPYENKTFWSELVVPDRKGVLRRIQEQMTLWQEDDFFIEYWDLADTGLYQVDVETRKGFLARQGLRYVDKRLTGQIKRAEEGSTLAAIGKAKNALSPKTTVGLGKDLKFKFSAKVLRGLMLMRLKNPYIDDVVVEYKALDSLALWDPDNYPNEAKIHMRENFRGIKAYAIIEYKFFDEEFRWEFAKGLTRRLFLAVITEQTNRDLPFSGGANKIAELRFNSIF